MIKGCVLRFVAIMIRPRKRDTGDTASPRVDSVTAESIPVLRSRFRYYRVDSGTANADVPVRQGRFRYYRIDSDIETSIPVWRSQSNGQKNVRKGSL